MQMKIKNTNIEIFGEEDYKEAMDAIVTPFLKENVKEGFFTSFDGAKLHYTYVIHPQERKRVVMTHGFCEYFGKFYEMMYLFYQMGCSVFFLELRGHGYSHKEMKEFIKDPQAVKQGADTDMVWIKDYHTYIDDMKMFLDKVVCVVPKWEELQKIEQLSQQEKDIQQEYVQQEDNGQQGESQAEKGPTGYALVTEEMLQSYKEKGGAGRVNLILYAHSMGGAVSSLFLENYPEYFEKAILSSPLLQMNFGEHPDIVVKLLMAWSKLAKWNLRYAPGQHGFDNVYKFKLSSDLSEERYAYAFAQRQADTHYQTYGGCFEWVWASIRATKEIAENANKITIPVMLFQAGRDTMVKSAGQDNFISKVQQGKRIRFHESKHEIYNATFEIRKEYYKEIYEFIEA